MSADHIIEDGEFLAYRVRIRFGLGDSKGNWGRASAAARDYRSREDAETAALECWRSRDGGTTERRDMDVEVIEVTTNVRPVAHILPAAVVAKRGEES